LTAWVVFFPKSNLVWSLFKGLPTPPDELKTGLNFVDVSVNSVKM